MERISFSRPQRTPPPSDATRPWTRTTANIAQSGSPGTARLAVAAAKAREMPVMAARGGSRSAPDRNSVAPSTWARDGPNMLTADSSGESVARYTSVPSARPLTVWAAIPAEEERKRGVNSGVRKRSR
ncbi:hypothetical protein GCM10010129_52340 [Streptomyces fumigatiscleroticus]|nr:hypothetical protein GCM10010129_52340 [Streptomyces fumigatiscleroticus]